MKLNIESAKDQMLDINEDINVDPATKLCVEIDNLNSIIESLAGDEYKNTRFNLSIINYNKLNNLYNIVQEEVSSSNELEEDYNKKRGMIAKFFNSFSSMLVTDYRSFKDSEKKILENTKSPEIKKLLTDIRTELGRFKTIYEAYNNLEKSYDEKPTNTGFTGWFRVLFTWMDDARNGGAGTFHKETKYQKVEKEHYKGVNRFSDIVNKVSEASESTNENDIKKRLTSILSKAKSDISNAEAYLKKNKIKL